jgi:hypothetical protein
MVLLSGLAAILPQPTVAAANLVTVRVTIEEVRATECFEGTFGGCLGAADFYSFVKLGSDAEVQGPTADDDNDPHPNWQFETTVDYNSVSSLPIYIEIRDEDGGFRLGDDLADVNGAPGIDKSVLDLTLTLGQVPCTISGDANGTCGIDITTQGNGDGDGTAALTFKVDVINTLPDGDSDGIPDSWESSGVTLNGQFINLPAMGADPNKPDVFLHIDWMQDATHNQSLSSAAIQQVVNAFANSPYTSPTGSIGINMHVDEGPGSTLNFVTGTTWGALSKAQSIPWQNNLGTLTGGQYDWTQFQAIKSANFDPTGRSPIFHYIIAGNYQEPPPPGGSQNTSSGISRGIGTSDLLITLGGFTGGTGTQIQQAGTLMHEFGHNLNLKHGGNENTNYKPNYFSIMNYLYQLRGLDVGTTAGTIDYAGGALPVLGPLNENAVNESNALGFSGFGVGSQCPAAGGGYTSQYTVNASGPFDWNCNGTATNGTLSFDANGSGGIDNNLTSYNDWANIQLRVGAIGDLGASSLPMLSDPEPVLNWDLTPPVTTAQPVPGPNGYGWNRVSVSVTLHAEDNAGGFGVRDITYSSSGVQSTPSTNVIGDTTSFVIGNEGVTTISYFARDQALNVESTKTLVLNIDLTNPTVVLGTAYPAPNAAGWNNTDVNVPFTATDALSGIASTTPPSSPLVLSAEGAAVSGTVTGYDKADNVTAVTTPAFKIDKTPPVITVSSPAPNQVFDSDQTMTPVFDATDALSGVKSIEAVLDTGQVVSNGTSIALGLLVGQRTLTVTATDVADNVAIVDIPFRVRPVFVGNAFDDPNESAMREAGEIGLGGMTVFLDNNGNGLLSAGEPSIVTGSDGAYRVVGEDIGPARICTLQTAGDRVRTTSRCQTVMVATGIPVPHTDFGSHSRTPGAKQGSVASVIQSVALAGQPGAYWRPADLVGTANGPWSGSRLEVKNGGANPFVQVQTGERIATGLFIGGVDAAQVGNLVLRVQAQPSNRQQVVRIVAADGSVATPTTDPTTSFAYAESGNILTIYGVPQDGLGGYQDIWLITEVGANQGNLTITASIDGSVQVVNGRLTVKALGNTSNDTSKTDITSGVTGTQSDALLVNDIPDTGAAINPF